MKKIISVLVLALTAAGMSLTAQNRIESAPSMDGKKLGMPGLAAMKDLNLTDDQKAKLKDLRQQFVAQDSLTRGQMTKNREALRAEHRQAMAKILTPEQLAKLDKFQQERERGVGREGQFGRGNGQRMLGEGGFARQGQMRGQMGGPQMGQMRGQMGRLNAPLAQGRGQMMNKRAQMLQGRGFQNGRFSQAQACPFCKKNAKAFAKQARRFQKAPMVNPEIRIKNQVERMTKQLDLTPEQAAKIQAIQEKHFKKDIAKYKKYEKKRDAQFKKRHGNLDEIKAVLTPDQAKKFENLKAQAPRMNGQGFQGGRNQAPNGPRGPMPGFGQGEN